MYAIYCIIDRPSWNGDHWESFVQLSSVGQHRATRLWTTRQAAHAWGKANVNNTKRPWVSSQMDDRLLRWFVQEVGDVYSIDGKRRTIKK